jgi:TIGR03009 family protein
MRILFLAALALGCLVGKAPAQEPERPAPLDPEKNQLDNYLTRWEDAMRKVDSMAVACTRTEVDAVYKTKRVYSGTIHFLRPSYFFWHMAIKDKPQEFERFICTGTYIYQYVPAEKKIVYYPAPKTTSEGRLADDSSLAFLFGMKAGEAKARYDLKLHNVDKNYIYVDVTPRNAVDKADFLRARLVLDKSSFLPRQIWFEHPNAGEVLWDLTKLEPGASIPKTAFAAPQTPKDWKLVAGQTSQPRVVRPQK